MAISSGSYTLGSGKDYTTWAAFWNDIANLTGNLTLTVDAEAFTEASAPAAVTETLGGYTLTVQAASYPTTTDGTTGARFTRNNTGRFLDMQMNGAGSVVIQGIVLLAGTGTQAFGYYTVSILTAFTFIVRSCVVKGASVGIYLGDATPTNNIYNNIIYNTYYGSGETGGIVVTDTLNGYVSNNTVIDTSGNTTANGIGVYNLTGLFDNNLVFGSKSSDYYQVASATGHNNSSEDATADDFGGAGSGSNRINKTTSPFTNYAADDFTLAASSDPIGNGKDLSASFTTDFFGNTRSTWDIGACAYISASSSITPHAQYYRRRRAA